MKKIYSFLLLAIIAFSCGDVDNVAVTNPQKQTAPVIGRLDPTKLAKVIIWPGVAQAEKHFYFYPNGLLRKITSASGGLIKGFVYDANKDLVTIQIPQQGNVYSVNFTYDASHRVTSMDGRAVNYDAATNSYSINYTPAPSNMPECMGCYDGLVKHKIELSSEYLATMDLFTYEEYMPGTPLVQYYTHGIYAGYDLNGNMGFTGNWTDPTNATYSHDNKVNPLKAAMLPFGRAMAVYGENAQSRMAWGEYNSTNNVVYNGYGNDPAGQTSSYVIEYNAHNLPKKTIAESYYVGVLESSKVSALYYYQGDVIP